MTYTIADVFRPDLGTDADGLPVGAFPVSSWTGTHTPPQLGDPQPGEPVVSTTTSTTYGSYGAWELQLPTNEDYFVSVEYDSTYYWRRYNTPAWTDGTTSELDVTTDELSGLVNADNVTIGGVTAGGLDTDTADIQSVSTTASASASDGTIGLAAFSDHVHSGGPAPGDIRASAAYTTSDGWLLCDGSAVSRAAYPDTYAALCLPTATGQAVTGATADGSEAMTSVVSPVLPLQPGWAITGPGVPLGTTITAVGDGTVELSQAATATEPAGTAYQVAPWGLGDGETTFNLPDLRSRVPLGQAAIASPFSVTGDTTSGSTLITGLSSVAGLGYGMAVSGSGIPAGAIITGIGPSSISISAQASATASGVALTIISNVTARNLGIDAAIVGIETVTLTTAQIAAHDHALGDPGHAHGVADPGHSHGLDTSDGDYLVAAAIQTFPGGAGTEIRLNNLGPEATLAAGTGIGIYGAYTGLTIASAGGGAAHNNMQPFVGVNYFIKVDD